MIKPAGARPAPEPWILVVGAHEAGSDQWDVALFTEPARDMAEAYYYEIVLRNPRVVEGFLASVIVHHTRPQGGISGL